MVIIVFIINLNLQDNFSLALLLGAAICAVGSIELLLITIISSLIVWFRGPLGARALSPAQADELRRSLEATTFPDAAPADGGNYKATLVEGRRRDYEALS